MLVNQKINEISSYKKHQRSLSKSNMDDYYKNDNPWKYSDVHLNFYNRLLSKMKVKFDSNTLIDIGSGEGYFLDVFMDYHNFNKIYPVDISGASLIRLKNKLDNNKRNKIVKSIVSDFEKEYSTLDLNYSNSVVMFCESVYYMKHPISFQRNFLSKCKPKYVVIVDSLIQSRIRFAPRECGYKLIDKVNIPNYSKSKCKYRSLNMNVFERCDKV